jgi:uncharacterized protein (TIGR02453 family)
MWHPDADALRMVRDTIVEHPGKWLKAVNHRSFKARYELSGDSLKRPPRGYDPEHPLLEDLKRKDFVAFTPLTEKEVCAADFLTKYAAIARASKSFMEFLTRAVGLRW